MNSSKTNTFKSLAKGANGIDTVLICFSVEITVPGLQFPAASLVPDKANVLSCLGMVEVRQQAKDKVLEIFWQSKIPKPHDLQNCKHLDTLPSPLLQPSVCKAA